MSDGTACVRRGRTWEGCLCRCGTWNQLRWHNLGKAYSHAPFLIQHQHSKSINHSFPSTGLSIANTKLLLNLSLFLPFTHPPRAVLSANCLRTHFYLLSEMHVKTFYWLVRGWREQRVACPITCAEDKLYSGLLMFYLCLCFLHKMSFKDVREMFVTLYKLIWMEDTNDD